MNGTNQVMNGTVAVCFTESTKILMADMTLTEIKNIQIGEHIMEDIESGKTNIVCNITSSKCHDLYKIQKRLIGNSEEIICSNHPIYYNNDENIIFTSNINGVEKIK